LTDEIRNNAFGELTEENADTIHLLYPPPEDHQDGLINRIVEGGWRSAADSAPVNISPCTDDRPFVGQMGLWKNFKWEKPSLGLGLGVSGYPMAQVIVVVILLVALVLVLPWTLVPYFRRGPNLGMAPWLYFFTIGMAFMAVEVVLIQKYTLFVGTSVYSITLILLTLLVSSGIGSRCSKRFGNGTAFLGIVVWLLLDVFVFKHVTAALGGLTMAPRVFVTAALVAPLGFFMGMPFPKGAAKVGPLIDWGFAVNGAASVVGGAGIILVAITFGFSVSLLVAAALYLFAYLLMAGTTRWVQGTPDAVLWAAWA
jgi:hypothetical protein